MTDFFTPIWNETLCKEGGNSNNPNDPGGRTKYGVTEAVARYYGYYGYYGDMRDLPLDKAKTIGKQAYWDVLRLDDVAFLSPSIAGELFDTSYNCGVGTAGKFLQTALNALNRNGADYPDLVVDGKVGRSTIGVLREFLNKRSANGELVLMRALNSLQGAHYINISVRNSQLENFVFGWFLNRVV